MCALLLMQTIANKQHNLQANFYVCKISRLFTRRTHHSAPGK